MQILHYCVYIKRRSEEANLALGFILKLWFASVFSVGEVITYSVCWHSRSLNLEDSTVDGVVRFQSKLLTSSDSKIKHILAVPNENMSNG